MATMILDALPREAAQKPKALRAQGKIPAVYYGRGQKNQSLQLDYQKFRKVYSKAGENTIIELDVEGKKAPVLVYEIQYDPVSDAIAHVDFIHVDMQKEVTIPVKIVIIGTSPAVKNLGGILDVQKHEVRIKCLPKDLIHSIEVDVSSIVDFHTTIHVKDLKVPPGIKVLDAPGATVVTATPPRAEEEAKPAEAASLSGVPGAEAVAGADGTAPAGAPGVAAAGAAPAGKGKEAKK